jgi:NAD(P)H-flavin reductase
MMLAPWRVAERWEETSDTFSMALEPASPAVAIDFLPGQFNMLYAFGAGESAISISGDPGLPGRMIHTIRNVGTVTSSLANLRPGDQLGVRGPFGTTWPMEALDGRDLVFVAGGIGLAPLRPAIYHALRHRSSYGDIRILVGSRTPSDILYAREFTQWRQHPGVSCEISVDRGDSQWHGHVGVVTKLIASTTLHPEKTAALICGPEVMMRYSAMELKKHGLPEQSIYLTMERNMKCAVAHCGHCQIGPHFICQDGPVYPLDRIAFWLAQREV